jgi:GTP-binding protein HflX
MASTTTVTTTMNGYHRSLNKYRRRKGPPNLAKVGRLRGAKVVSSATKKNCETHDVSTDDDVNDVDVFLEDEDEWTKEDVNDKKDHRGGESGSIGGDNATRTKRSPRTTLTTLTEAGEEVKEEAKDEYENLTWEEIIEREYGGGTQKSMVSPSTSRRYDLGGHDGSRNDDDDDSKDYWETRIQPLRCVVVGVGKKGREYKKNEKKKNADETFSVDDSLSELERLCDAAGLVVVGRVTQNLRTPNARTFLGRGKISELREVCGVESPNVVAEGKKMKLNGRGEYGDNIEDEVGSFDWDESEDEDEEWEEEEEDDSSGSSFEMYYKDYGDDDDYGGDDDDDDDEIFAFKRKQFADLVVFDDELTPKQGVNIEKALGDKLRVCDRTALILDIFSQRARTAEGAMQVEIGQLEYQLPRITKLWTHLERQSGSGNVKGMGEKQIEIDKRLLKDKISQLRKKLRSVKTSRDQRRDQNRDKNGAPIAPTIALAGYTNAGKSSLMNALCGDEHARVQDELFHTLDPLTRRLNLPSGGNCRVVDTVGFIQKLPTQLVAAFRATLEEVAEANLVLHVIDISSELATAQMAAVDETLEVLLRERNEKDGSSVFEMPTQISVWNKLDNLSEYQRQDVEEAAKRINSKNKSNKVFIVSARTGEGLDELRKGLESVLAEKTLRRVELRVPFSESGKLIGEFRKVGVVEREEWDEENALIVALVPISMSERADVVGYYSSWVSSFSAR